MESDDFGDWRIAVVTTLTSDITAAFPGGPSHKVGTPVYVSSLFLKSRDELPAALEGQNSPTETVEFANLAFNYRAE